MSAEWAWVVTKRDDATPTYTFSSDDTAEDSPIVALEGQDAANQIGILSFTLPAEHDANDFMVEDDLIHLFERGEYVTSYIIKVPQVTVISPQGQAAEFATYQCSHLLGVTEEGMVEPPNGMDRQPTGPDRAFDYSLIELDDTSWDAATVLTPFGGIPSVPADMPPGSSAEFIASRDFDTTGGEHNHPLGTWYVRHHFTLGGSDDRQCRLFAIFDDNGEYKIDGVWLDSRIGVDPPSMLTPRDILLSPGDHTIALKITNIPRTGNTSNFSYAMFSVWTMVDGSDVLDTEIAYSSAASLTLDYPATPPGLNGGEIVSLTLAEEQAFGALVGVGVSFTPTEDSDGNPFNDPVEFVTKSGAGLDQCWLNELTAAIIDIDAHFDFDTARIIIDVWNKGAHHPPSGLTLTEGVNLGEFTMPHARRVASSLAVQWNEGNNLAFHTVDDVAPVGTSVKRRGFTQGAAHSIEQVERDGASQIALFNRQRSRPTLTHLTTTSTPDDEMPPAYWKWSTIDVAVTSRWLTSGTVTLVAVAFRLTANGVLEFTPVAGDLIVPLAARSSLILRRMASPKLGGQSRVASPVSLT